MTYAEKIARDWLIEHTHEANQEISENDVLQLIHNVAVRTREECWKAIVPTLNAHTVVQIIRGTKWELQDILEQEL